jgi:hypothetical protein
MTKFASFASDLRVRVLLCSSVTVLLTACGGGADTGTTAAADLPPQNAAYAFNSDAAPAARDAAPDEAVAAVAENAPSDDLNAAADTSPANFEITGYETDATAADGDQPSAAATASEAAVAPETAANDAATGSAPTRLLAQTVAVRAVTPATSNNFYVAPNGSDTNPGTKAKPFKTLARAAKATKASTTVFVAPGTYAGGIKTTVSGSASGRIYYVSTTRWGAKIVPPANSTNDSAWDNRGNYVDIIGFDIDGSKSQAGKKWLHGVYNGGSYDSIRENHVHHIARNVPCNGAGGSAIGVDSYYRGVKSDVIGNSVHDIGPAGCKYVQGIYVSTSGSVKNNIVYRVSAAAIHLWHDANNVIITNNTVAASNFGIIVGGGDFYNTTAGANNVAVYSNIVYDNTYGVSEQGKTGKSNTYRNNLVYQNKYNWTLKNGLTHSGTVSSAPLFVSYNKTSGTPNFHLASSSPAIGRGISSYAHPTDFDGKPRNASTGYTIGAYQR